MSSGYGGGYGERHSVMGTGDTSARCPPVMTMRRAHTSMLGSDGKIRPVCKFGVSCYQRNPKHTSENCHPADPDYFPACREQGVQPEFISIFGLFIWCDADGSGKATKEEMQQLWPVLQNLSQTMPAFSEELWLELDDDGNGFVNFSEFAEFTTKHKVNLPLGLDSLRGSSNMSNQSTTLRCGVTDCLCRDFRERRARCRFGADCYQKATSHTEAFAHPKDKDWKDAKTTRDTNMCRCGHKNKLHSSDAVGVGSVEYPDYWTSVGDGETEFNDLNPASDATHSRIQALVEASYSDVTTRDRVRHSKEKSWMVPRDYTVVSCLRNENSKLWRKYTFAKLSLQNEKELSTENPEMAAQLPDYTVFDDVLTTTAWETSGGQPLDKSINEWYLWHGTSKSAAQNICKHDFKLRLAGTATGTLYGRGTYFAESITKADEYAREENGCYTVLLCRVLGGRVQYSDTREVDPEQLTKDCVEGPYDCVVGDRRKISGTYREFIIFDAENVYPEFVVSFKRGELFKSKSHP